MNKVEIFLAPWAMMVLQTESQQHQVKLLSIQPNLKQVELCRVDPPFPQHRIFIKNKTISLKKAKKITTKGVSGSSSKTKIVTPERVRQIAGSFQTLIRNNLTLGCVPLIWQNVSDFYTEAWLVELCLCKELFTHQSGVLLNVQTPKRLSTCLSSQTLYRERYLQGKTYHLILNG